MIYTNRYHFVSIPRRLLTIHTQCLPREWPPPPNNHGLRTPRIAATGGRLTLWWLRTAGAGLRLSFVASSAATTNSNNLGKQTWLTLLAWPIHIKFRYYYYYLDYIIYRLNKQELSDIPIHIKFRYYYYYIMMMSKFMFYAWLSHYWPNCWDGKTKKKGKEEGTPQNLIFPVTPHVLSPPASSYPPLLCRCPSLLLCRRSQPPSVPWEIAGQKTLDAYKTILDEGRTAIWKK